MFVMCWFVIFTTMFLNIFITQDHLISFKKITKNSDKQMDNLLIMFIYKLQKVSSKNVIYSPKWTNILKYKLSKIKINNFLSMISKINKLLVFLLNTKLKPLSLMLKVNSILSIILMIFYNNKKIPYNNNQNQNVKLKNRQKSLRSKKIAKNK